MAALRAGLRGMRPYFDVPNTNSQLAYAGRPVIDRTLRKILSGLGLGAIVPPEADSISGLCEAHSGGAGQSFSQDRTTLCFRLISAQQRPWASANDVAEELGRSKFVN